MLFRPTSTLFSKSSTSKAWISRQFRDPYVKQRLSDPASYRARSAFKLLEIDAAWGNFLMKPDVTAVVDLGAAPGGWSQVVAGKLGWSAEMPPKRRMQGLLYKARPEALERYGSWSEMEVGDGRGRAAETFDPLNIDDSSGGGGGGDATRRRGTIVAVDLLRMQPIRGVHMIQADFLSPEAEMLIHGLLMMKGNLEGKVDVILSDMAANVSGNQIRDTESSLEICNAVFEFARSHLRSAESVGRRRGGVLLLKHFTHPLLHRFRMEKLEPNFNDVRYIKPSASRTESKEGYFLCQGWTGEAH